MSVYFDKERRQWRFDFVIQGRRWTGRGFVTKRAASDAEAEERRKAIRSLSAVYLTFADLVDDFLAASARTKTTAWAYQLKLKLNKGFAVLAGIPPHELKRGHFERCLNDLARPENELSARSVNEYRKIAASVMNYAVNMEAIERNPLKGLPKIPEPAVEARVVSTADLKAAMLAADAETKALLMFLSQTGARINEALNLKWPEVFIDSDRPFAVLTTRKTRGGHESKAPQPLTATAVQAINGMRGKHASWVFPGPAGQLQYQTAHQRLDRACRRAGIDRFSFHAVRHWCGLQAVSMGRSKKAVAQFLRHSDTSITERYLHAIDSELWDVARRLEAEVGVCTEQYMGGELGGKTVVEGGF